MKKSRKPEQFIRRPGFPGGPEAMKEFIRQNLRYPEEALKNGIEGTVAVAYDFNEKGEITEAHIKHSLGYGCDEEALRLVKLLRFNAVKHRKMNVTFHGTINIFFRLNKGPVKEGSNFAFTYAATPPKPEEEDAPKPVTYTYSIPLKND